MTAAIWFFRGACLAISRRLNHTWILRRVSDLRDLRKKKGKMSILVAKSRPCKCGSAFTRATFSYENPHLHGRLLATRINILPFFFLKSRRSLTRRKIQVWFCLRDIARHAPKKIKSQQSLTRERFYRDARIRLQLAEVTRWDCVPVILAKSSRRKSRYRTGSLTRCEKVSKCGLLVLNLAKANCC